MRRILVGFVAIALFGAAPAFANAGGDKDTPRTAKGGVDPSATDPNKVTGKAHPAKPENVAPATELQKLRDLIQAQQQQLTEQRKALDEQQQEINALQRPGRDESASPSPVAPKTDTNSASAPVTRIAESISTHHAASAPAQTPAAEAKETKLSDLAYGKIHIGATFFGDWAYYTDTGFGPQFLTQLNQDGPGNSGFNSFDITRTYINFFYTPNEAVTLRLTPNIYRQVDVAGATSNGKGSGIASSSNGNVAFRLKYAYVDFNTLFKNSDTFKKDKLTVGQTTNPLVDWEEGLYGYRYVNLVPWNYLSLSSTYTGITLHGPIEFNGKEYLDYHLGVFNTASFHSIETNDKKQAMARLTWYPVGTTSDRTGLGVTAFENYGYNTKTPDAISTPLNRLAILVHYQNHSKAYSIVGEYDLG
ncbi:MAG: type IV pilus assembly protein FimV, partial [Candidatus Acidiferrales bacterium]